jgi:Protein of unknown function (DUF1592)/Protein of unknown function (DUF1588)/PA14 domain/Protein of unknown function (DUF1595)/Cytochrome C oxidase, cbb3-type, subunit III
VNFSAAKWRFWWLTLLLGLFPASARSAEPESEGRRIFLEECAKCHGREGEGVQGKFDQPLRGTRTLEKLTRFIERNMPDDAPGDCVGPDAAAVARYIYNAFYSPDAVARKTPARIELMRLTNKQFLTSVADLLKDFTGRDGTLEGEPGLQATYYHSKDFNSEKKAFERVDRKLEFDFGESGLDKEHQTNAFSIQWHGSLLAEESGSYEFTLKTPNGVRLWVNDTEEPLIDAWVSSGQVVEHRATIHLLGGRAYPIRLHFFKYHEKTASLSLWWKPPHGALQLVPARNLSTGHSTPTFVVSTAFPPDDSSVGYERGTGVSRAWDEATTQAALETANYVVQHLDGLSHSRASDTNRPAKLQDFCGRFVARAFRRPLTEQQKQIFLTNQLNQAGSPEDGVKRVVLLALKSPRFLYLGLQPGKPDDFEVAARLSFALWDSLPDESLWQNAQKRNLHTQDQVAQQARRMLEDPRAHLKVLLFLHHWLQVDRLEPLPKDEKCFPGFSPEIIADLRTSLNLFLEQTVWKGSSDYRQLLQADYLFLNGRLAAFYGVSTNLDEDFTRVSFDAEHRSGVLTHPYLLSAFSYPKLTSPIHRGVFLTRNIVGRALRPPPMAMTFKDAEFGPTLTMREKVSQLTRPQACQACHSVINPLGFSLEAYDAVGRFRTRENDKPVNVTSDYITEDGDTVHLAGARDVAKFAIASEQAQNVFIEQLFHHLVKEPIRAYGSDVMQRLREDFVKSEFNIQKLLGNIATIAALHGVE